MLIYLETKAKSYPISQQILQNFPKFNIIEIQHYKDIFDKNIWNFPLEECLILAKQENPQILPAPSNYGYPNSHNFFFKPAINCLLNCTYCYLQWTFKNHFPVIFVNYDDIQQSISDKIKEERKSWYKWQLTFYASNYSDLRATENLTHFHQHFIPFFEQFDNVLMESRTKSSPVILNESRFIGRSEESSEKNKSKSLDSSPRSEWQMCHTEIAFSLNPQSIITTYEHKTANLEARLQSIQNLLNQNYRVWLRFLPLLPVPDYQTEYKNLITQIKSSINTDKIASIFIAPLVYNQQDLTAIQKKQPTFHLLSSLSQNKNWLFQPEPAFYNFFENLFKSEFPNHTISRDYR